MGEWYKRMFEDVFGKYWERIFSFKEKKETDQEVSFLKDLLSEGLILDDACGLGRISIPLSRYVSVVGLDLSSYLLRKANQRAKDNGIQNFYLVRGDMRYLPFKSDVFHSVISIWTSFGYFSERENEVALREVVRVLKRGGSFILDMPNPLWLIKIFRERDWWEDEEYITLEQRSVNWKRKRWKEKWTIMDKQTKNINEISFEHRLYDIKELQELLSKEGFKINRVYGSFQKEDFKETNSRRIIILSEKR